MNNNHNWNKTQAESAQIPNFGKKYVGEAELQRMLGGNISGKKILELGSGNGYWLELLAKRGAICTGIEISEEQLKLADKNNPKITYIKGDITKLERSGLKKSYYDVILIEHVLLEIPSLKKIDSIMSASYKLLKKSGIIIISDLHPLAALLGTKNFRVNNNFNYFSSGTLIEVVSTRIDGEETKYKDFHWTLSDIVGSITKAGFLISKITEPRPSLNLVRRYPELKNRLTIPKALWIKAVKI